MRAIKAGITSAGQRGDDGGFSGRRQRARAVEGQRVTIIVNAAGALVCWCSCRRIWPQAGAVPLKRFVLYGIAAFAAGIGIAMLGYVARYCA